MQNYHLLDCVFQVKVQLQEVQDQQSLMSRTSSERPQFTLKIDETIKSIEEEYDKVLKGS
jgi:hypothetical protein